MNIIFRTVYGSRLFGTHNENSDTDYKQIHKENLRNIPGNGIGFGLLKYMSDDTEIKKSLSGFPEPQVVFNYLGQMNFQFLPNEFVDLLPFLVVVCCVRDLVQNVCRGLPILL